METLQISLAAARINAGMKQKEVADAMKVDRSTIGRWEKGEKVPGYDEAKELAKIYGLSVDNIFFGKKTR